MGIVCRISDDDSYVYIKGEGVILMPKNKIIVSFSIPIEVKDMLKVLAERNYSSNTKYIVDLIRRDYKYWFENKKLESVKEKIKEVKQ